MASASSADSGTELGVNALRAGEREGDLWMADALDAGADADEVPGTGTGGLDMMVADAIE
jgi:hypothetical protein